MGFEKNKGYNIILEIPIRNWNRPFGMNFEKPKFDIRNTYKELKLKNGSTMRLIHYLILEIPIRNWNDEKTPHMHFNVAHIRNTYKELKRAITRYAK